MQPLDRAEVVQVVAGERDRHREAGGARQRAPERERVVEQPHRQPAAEPGALDGRRQRLGADLPRLGVRPVGHRLRADRRAVADPQHRPEPRADPARGIGVVEAASQRVGVDAGGTGRRGGRREHPRGDQHPVQRHPVERLAQPAGDVQPVRAPVPGRRGEQPLVGRAG
ncbi:MAG TPA: hypothetical protein PKC20_20300, partial [Burkholderiaceae bacterium]|nr:hypothetical protein [Burkholderiaceae bacterium]